MKTISLLFCLQIISVAALFSQERGMTEKSGLYFDLKPPGLTPEIFAPGIISTGQFEFGCTFSPDGHEIYFTRRPDDAGSDNRIYSTVLVNGRWTEQELAPFASDVFEFIPSVTPRGDMLFFYSDRAKPDNIKYDGNLWFCRRTENGWSTPEFLDTPVNQKYSMTVSSTFDGVIYYSAVYNRRLCILRFDPDKPDELGILPDNINKYNPAHPFIAPDERCLIFDSQIKGMGNPELYVSFKKDAGNWTDPVNMGPLINASGNEFNGTVSPDGKYFFFHRKVNGNGDIWWVSATIIEELRKLTENQ